MKKLKIIVKGMACEGCLGRVQRVVSKIEGIHQIDASLETGEFNIEAEERVNSREVMARIQTLGYQVEEV